jgi:hypothetical protein
MHDENLQTISSNHTGKPALSLILCSRNDQYMGNSLWRLQTALNSTAKNIHELGREEHIEIILSDWGSEVPLREVLKLSSVAAAIVKFVNVPPRIAREVQRDSPFSEVHALNAAVRRANGRYIGRIDQDTLVGKRFFKTFLDMLEHNTQLKNPIHSVLLFSNRRSVPYRFVSQNPSFASVNRFIQWFGPILRVENHLKHKPHLFYCSYVGIWLLHRSLWYECRGYDERLIYMNEMESDMAARLMERYKMVDLGKLVDYDFYHLSHYHPRAIVRARAHRKLNPKRWHEVDLNYKPGDITPNSENWGLIQHPLGVLSYSRICSELGTRMRGEPLMNWLLFILLLIITGAQIIWDSLIMALRSTWRFLFHFSSVWTHRSRVAWQAVYREPLISWPRLLTRLWHERKSAQIQK